MLMRQTPRLNLDIESALPLREELGGSLVAALNPGDAIGQLQALATDAAPATRQSALDGLATLCRLATAPPGIAAGLEQIADRAINPEAALRLPDAAVALRESEAVLRFGSVGSAGGQ